MVVPHAGKAGPGAAAADALIAAGGYVTHHHAVGCDHRPWYDRQRSQLLRCAHALGLIAFAEIMLKQEPKPRW
ncbi:hypothetical protein CO683_13250 [Bradyrhizobium ottawaense]|uniref:FAD-linked oxidase C-terminal domain-containing protein n=1 Tax=Bradyrhizobium TaxID=374 RepID=UPI000BE8F6B9|nr:MULTISPECIES: FAD-linked oxidase C-terminal domain-containing protein [Bradyrhizobium]PDT68962.1 hypothetical protein CO683_13250 [Bradyrhizobium ottawaense]